jgi:hypothetical protein
MALTNDPLTLRGEGVVWYSRTMLDFAHDGNGDSLTTHPVEATMDITFRIIDDNPATRTEAIHVDGEYWGQRSKHVGISDNLWFVCISPGTLRSGDDTRTHTLGVYVDAKDFDLIVRQLFVLTNRADIATFTPLGAVADEAHDMRVDL